eukprot:gene5307-7195_t
MAASVGSIIFVVVVVGGMGSLAGAFIASLLIGVVQTFAVALDYSLIHVFKAVGVAVTDQTFGYELLKLTISQVAPILPTDAMNTATTTASTSTPVRYYRFKPLNIGRILIWSFFALLLIVAPMIFTSSLALTMLSQIGYLIIICLSYNILLGQGGMLSFGHAVYVGLGSFIAIHAMNFASAGKLPIPLVLIPLVGGLGGMFFAMVFGYVSTKKSGTTFAMITLGLGELVAAMALMFPSFFGGEG